MKSAKTGDYLLWKGVPAKIVYSNEGHRSVGIEILENTKCPNCGEDLGKKQIDVIVSSPMYQENAEPMQTIKVPY